MRDSLRRTPDGRITRYGAKPSDHGHGTHDPRLKVLQPFIDACLSMLPDPPPTGNARLGFLLFLLGAADRLWQRLDLDETRFPAFAMALLQRHGLPAPEATTLAFALPQVGEEGMARDALVEGAETLEDWLDGHDGNSVMRLGELITRWRRG